jgi:hypothetical protein
MPIEQFGKLDRPRNGGDVAGPRTLIGRLESPNNGKPQHEQVTSVERCLNDAVPNTRGRFGRRSFARVCLAEMVYER